MGGAVISLTRAGSINWRRGKKQMGAPGDGSGRAHDDQAAFQPYWGKPGVRNERTPRQCHRVASKPAGDRQNLPLDALVSAWHHESRMSGTGNQFSLTCEASMTGGAAEKQIRAGHRP